MTTTATHTRRTSAYTVYLPEVSPREVQQITDHLPAGSVSDRSGYSVSFRSTDDRAAWDAAFTATLGISEWMLTTGLGVHRREVTA